MMFGFSQDANLGESGVCVTHRATRTSTRFGTFLALEATLCCVVAPIVSYWTGWVYIGACFHQSAFSVALLVTVRNH